MPMQKNELQIDVLGTSIIISAEEEPEYLDKLLDTFRRAIGNVQQKSGLKDPLKTAILTGFLLCDELEKAGKPHAALAPAQSIASNEAMKIALGMISRLDDVLPDIPESTKSQAVPQSPAEKKPAALPVFKLENTVKNYAWGSTESIPAFLGKKNVSRVPWAELWMGVHPGGPSRIAKTGSSETQPLLSEMIDKDITAFLGEITAVAFGKLPFLFKVLAAAKPLSIQAHPGPEQAREGFERENRERIPLDAPARNYRDPNHKPEILCALEPFAALCGFRAAAETSYLLEIFSQESEGILKLELQRLLSSLSEDDNPYKAFLTALYRLGDEVCYTLGRYIKANCSLLVQDFPEYRDEWQLCSYLADLFPEDPGLLAPLYLNIVKLEKGEAIYLPSGVLHSYIHGMGIELMADSDNVLRGGLTSKHINEEELLRILDFSAYKPEILKAPPPNLPYFSYPTPAEEFTLSVMQGQNNPVSYNEGVPAIVLITEGTAIVSEEGDDFEMPLSKGESAFISAASRLVFHGSFTAYIASCRS